MLSFTSCLKFCGSRFYAAFRVFDAEDQIMCILRLIPLVEGEGFQTCEADKISVTYLLNSLSLIAKQTCANFLDFVMVEDHRGVRYVERGNISLSRKGLNFAFSIGIIRK